MKNSNMCNLLDLLSYKEETKSKKIQDSFITTTSGKKVELLSYNDKVVNTPSSHYQARRILLRFIRNEIELISKVYPDGFFEISVTRIIKISHRRERIYIVSNPYRLGSVGSILYQAAVDEALRKVVSYIEARYISYRDNHETLSNLRKIIPYKEFSKM